MTETRELSARLKERGQILDEATRNRRQRNAIEALEKDNFQEVQSFISDFKLLQNKKLQMRFNVDHEDGAQLGSTGSADTAKKRRLRPESKLKFRKNFNALIEEEQASIEDKPINYFSICVPESRFPPRKFCSVCGFASSYTCVQCGTKYCSSKCLQTHKDTRCLKWTA